MAEVKRGEKRQTTLYSHFGGDAAPTTSSNTSDGTRKKYCRDQHRVLTDEHKRLFPWLVQNDGKLYCLLCQKNKRENTFTKGKSCERPKKDDFVKHERSRDHR